MQQNTGNFTNIKLLGILTGFSKNVIFELVWFKIARTCSAVFVTLIGVNTQEFCCPFILSDFLKVDIDNIY